MVHLRLFDNNRGGQTVGPETLNDLQRIANRPLSDILAQEDLLLLPDSLGHHGDEIADTPVLSIHDTSVKTYNMMGFVGLGNTQLKISSRFAGSDTDHFLHYMILKVMHPQLLKLDHTIHFDSIYDYLLLFFPRLLKSAMSQGIYKEYQHRRYNNENVRGAVDVKRHLRDNVPFSGKIAYATRDHTWDNDITQLVRHTIEHIRARSMGATILTVDSDTITNVRLVQDSTPSYQQRQRRRVLQKNLRPRQHPYFSAYEPLRKLCVQILNHDRLTYGIDDDHVHGMLFDGAWLWEEYLNTFIGSDSPIRMTHAENKTRRNGIPAFIQPQKKRWLYPDFYSTSDHLVIDAKYKRLAASMISREDLHQMVTYMYILKARNGILLYPHRADSLSQPHTVIGELNGHGLSESYADSNSAKMHTLGFPIPSSRAIDEFSTFRSAMENSETICQELLSKIPQIAQ